MTVDPGQMAPQSRRGSGPRGGMTAESMAAWEAYLKPPAVVADCPVETSAPVSGGERHGRGIPGPGLVPGDLVDVGVAQYEVVVGRDGELALRGPVNRRGDRGGLW